MQGADLKLPPVALYNKILLILEVVMEHQIVTFYLLCHELLKALGIREDCQIKMNNAEVMVVVLVAAAFFGGNFRMAASFLKEHGYIQNMPEKADCHDTAILMMIYGRHSSELLPKHSKAGIKDRNTSRTVFPFQFVTISVSPV